MSEDTQNQLIWGTVLVALIVGLGFIIHRAIDANEKFWIACMNNGNQYVSGQCIKVSPTVVAPLLSTS